MAKKRTHKWAFPLGLALVALAVVGVVSLVNMAVQGVRELTDDPQGRLRYEVFLANVVARDPDPFESPLLGNQGQLLDITLWSLLRRADNTPADFPMDDDGNLMIAQDVAAERYRLLFGVDLPAHMTVETDGFDFVYDAEAEVYRVPIAGELLIFVPRVVNINRTGRSVELTVEYLAVDDFNLDETNRQQDLVPVRTMIITLNEQDNEDVPWQVSAIRHPMGVDVAGGSPVLN